MKLRILMGIICVAIFGVSGAVYAESLDFSNSKWEVSLSSGTAISVQEDSAGSLVHVTGRVTYDLTPKFAVGVTSGWIGYKVDVQGDDWGHANSMPILATVLYRFPIESQENRVVPYVVGGIGAMLWNMEDNAFKTDNAITVKDDASFVAMLGVGVDYYFTEHIGAFGEISFVTNKLETSIDVAGTPDKLVGENDSVFLAAGVKARF